MTFSTQLRLILLLAGGVAILLIYLFGRRHGRVAERAEQNSLRHNPGSPSVQDFGPAAEMDEEELDTPAYLRRSHQEMRSRDESLPTIHLPAGVMLADVHDPQADEAASASALDQPEWQEEHDWHEDEAPTLERQEYHSLSTVDMTRVEPTLDDHAMHGMTSHDTDEPAFQELPTMEVATQPVAVPVVTQTASWGTFVEPPTMPNITHEVAIPVVEQAVSPQALEPAEKWVEPAVQAAPEPSTVEVTTPPAASSQTQAPAPANTKRKIVALRLSVPQRIPGELLLSLLQREHLQHGRFNIFHRLQDDASVFSIASMVEPGSFDLSTMREQRIPGITFFMLLPGPLDGLVAWDQMYSCAQRLAQATEGVLQDERGRKLTSLAADRLREEVLDFQHLLGALDVIPH